MERALFAALSERDTATSLPSGEGTAQSIVVVPFVFSLFGSRTTFSEARLSGDFSVTSHGCCAGGWNFMAKINPSRRSMIE